MYQRRHLNPQEQANVCSTQEKVIYRMICNNIPNDTSMLLYDSMKSLRSGQIKVRVITGNNVDVYRLLIRVSFPNMLFVSNGYVSLIP